MSVSTGLYCPSLPISPAPSKSYVSSSWSLTRAGDAWVSIVQPFPNPSLTSWSCPAAQEHWGCISLHDKTQTVCSSDCIEGLRAVLDAKHKDHFYKHCCTPHCSPCTSTAFRLTAAPCRHCWSSVQTAPGVLCCPVGSSSPLHSLLSYCLQLSPS